MWFVKLTTDSTRGWCFCCRFCCRFLCACVAAKRETQGRRGLDGELDLLLVTQPLRLTAELADAMVRLCSFPSRESRKNCRASLTPPFPPQNFLRLVHI